MRPEHVRLARRYPLVTLFLLACAFSSWGWPLYAAGLSPSPIGGFGPFLTALVVLAITHGRAGNVTLLRRTGRRAGARWYAVALLLPLLITGAAAVLNVLPGALAPAPVA